MSVSTLTTNDICARVRARWGAALPLVAIPRAEHNIALCIFGACERLAKSVKESNDRNLLVKEINATPSAGVIDLSGATYKNIFTDTYRLPGAVNTQSETSVVFKHVPSLDALRAATPTDSNCVWYTLRGKKITFKNPSNGALNVYAIPVTLAGSYIPTIDDATLPMVAELEDQLIDRLSEIVKQLGGLQFLKMDEDLAATVAGTNG